MLRCLHDDTISRFDRRTERRT